MKITNISVNEFTTIGGRQRSLVVRGGTITFKEGRRNSMLNWCKIGDEPAVISESINDDRKSYFTDIVNEALQPIH